MKLTRKQLERLGWTFHWAYSAYVVCVRRPDGSWFGTFDMHGCRGFSVPVTQINQSLEA